MIEEIDLLWESEKRDCLVTTGDVWVPLYQEKNQLTICQPLLKFPAVYNRKFYN
jgi:hypothetical protein